MSNLSKIRRDKMIQFLETLKEQHSDDESLIAMVLVRKWGDGFLKSGL